VTPRTTSRTLALVFALWACLAVPVGAAEDVEALERRARAFYEMLERGSRDRAVGLASELERDLAAAYARRAAELDRMREAVTDNDDDLEALYATPRWRETEIASLVLAYHLAWVRYQLAQLSGEGPRRKQLLEEAIDGFSQFTGAPDVPEIYAESLYGRGLAYLDLGRYRDALADLEQAAALPSTSSRAKAAIEEARRRQAGGTRPPPPPPAEDDPEVLAAKLGDLLQRVGAGDAAAEQPATELARGLAARGGPWPDRIARLVGERLGEGTPTSVRSSYGLWLLGQLAIDRGRCAEVEPLARAGAVVQDKGRMRHRPALLFLDAGCRLNAGHAREAAEAFAALLQQFPQADQAREAAYYRVRALDLARARDPALSEEMESAARAYLDRWPKTDAAPEVRYLLAELYRARGACDLAGAEYAQVPPGAFALRARMGVLECRVAQLSAKTSRAERAVLARDLGAFARTVPASGADTTLGARAALLAGLVAAGLDPPAHEEVVAALEGFEQRYAAATDLIPRALELRLLARVGLGQVQTAEQDLEALLAAGGPPGGSTTFSRVGRQLLARAETGMGEERARALALARRAYTALLERDGRPADRLVLADIALRTGDVQAARRAYDEVLALQPDSAEALRGAARAATAAGDQDAALGYWRRIVETSPAGGTAWYEARLAQVELLAASGRRAQACTVVRQSRGRATTAGGDVLARRLQTLEAEVCR